MPIATTELSETGLLAAVAEHRAAAQRHEIAVLELAVQWAHAHPLVDERTGEIVPTPRVAAHVLAAHFVGIDPEEPLDSAAWAGLPRVAWDAPAAFGAAANISTVAASTILRDALILAHRLPSTWARVRAGAVPAWRARLITTAVAGAPDDVCAHVDAAVADRAETLGTVALTRAIRSAMIALYPDEVEAASLERLDAMYVRVETGYITETGLTHLAACGEYAELDDLDRTLTRLAAVIDVYDETIPVDAPQEYRRARALGLLSDPASAAALLASMPGDGSGAADGAEAPARRVHLVVHLSDAALAGTDVLAGIGHSLGATPTPVFADAVAAWCGRPSTAITVHPVIDLHETARSDGYRPSAALARQVELRDVTCRFPHCGRAASRADKDHVIPHARGGPTSSDNLIALCRHHHRLKTHAGYLPAVVEPGVVHWSTPHGFEYLVTRHGTRLL
ncbi:HNH endonuclease signature motif containing protein [Nocardioides sp. R-C-SC26]|uniref:HNH endonuclease signature motif containing protein n=1 Tax=Nocardioides sp. R-C-SC26 TaxID=2870414 RepID=UPI001E3ACD90|nr:HNH endonuclease signature motif containing protein [Nocardioides sp. R-C-SC26]